MALATVENLTSGPLNNIVRQYSQQEETNLLTRASRAIENLCGRRLAPFTGLVESHRAEMVDPDDIFPVATPVDPQGTMAMSRVQALGSSDLVRHMWLREYPPRLADYWIPNAAITNINILRSIAGTQSISGANLLSQVQYEPETGHIRFYFGAYIPPGSTLQVTYSGGYNPVPEDLIQATILRAALMALIELVPERRDQFDLTAIKAEIAELVAPYVRDGDDF